MKRTILQLLIFILNIFLTFSVFGQSIRHKNSYHQQNFERNKIYDQTYALWKYNNKWVLRKNDTLSFPYFVDDRNYEGLINYGVSFRSKDYRTFTYIEGHHMHFLKVDFEKAIFSPKDSIIEIEGYVSGGWGDLVKKERIEEGIDNRIDVFLGEKTDTTKNLLYKKVVNDELIEVKLKGVVVNENTILDTFPAFYFKNYSHYTTLTQGKRYFKIKGKVANNTLLAFGGHNCYSEVFDLGAMVYYPYKNKNKKIKHREELSYKTLIQNNELLSEIGKEKTKEVKYYTYTEKAEDHIFKRQYGFGKESYLLLDKEYKTIYARDIHNAIRCAVLSRDYKNAFYFGKKLAQKGIEKKYFNAKIFNLLKKNSEWYAFISSYDSLYKESQSKKDVHLKQQIEKLVEEDQADYGLENRKGPQILFETTEKVTDKLIDLLKREGFPSEEKIGVYTKNDTVLISSPDYNVLIRHAVQQNPKNLATLNEILEKFNEALEYDKKRSTNHRGFINSCFQIYKGNLYNNKSCSNNDLMVRKIKFMFSNSNNFIVDQGDYIITEYDKENPEEYDKYYKENFNLIMKLTEDWEFYED
jgi:hypothetical protein